MAAVIKQISVFENNGWSNPPYDIGAKAQNISLDPSILEQTNVQSALSTIVNQIPNVSTLNTDIKTIKENVLEINENNESEVLNTIKNKVDENIKIKEYRIPLNLISQPTNEDQSVDFTDGSGISGTMQVTHLTANTWNTGDINSIVYTITLIDETRNQQEDVRNYIPISVAIRANANVVVSAWSFEDKDTTTPPTNDGKRIYIQFRLMSVALNTPIPSGNIRIIVTYLKNNNSNHQIIIKNLGAST